MLRVFELWSFIGVEIRKPSKGRAMLSNQVRDCFRHAEECMQQAATQTDPKLRRNYLIIGACWLKLIRELSELPADFSISERQVRQFAAPAKLRESMEEGTPLAH
jgi:hypothetical protein